MMVRWLRCWTVLQASKAALHSMCDTLEMEMKPFGISLTEVWAGTMKTDINAKVAEKLERLVS